MNLPNCSGVIGMGFERLAGEALAHSGVASALLISSLSVFTISGRHLCRADDGVPLHAVEALEAQLLEGRHVGQQRMALEPRDRDGLHLAALDVAAIAAARPGIIIWVWPPSTSVMAGPMPRYGACTDRNRRLLELLHREVRERALPAEP